MLPIKHLAQKIFMELDYCGRQVAQCFWWAKPSILKEVQSIVLGPAGIGSCVRQEAGLMYLGED